MPSFIFAENSGRIEGFSKKTWLQSQNDVKFTVFVWSAFKMWVWSKNSLPFAEFGDL